jgi:hypothetical protein
MLTLSGGVFDLDVTVIITKDTDIALQYVQEHLDSTATLEDFNSRATTFPTQDGKSPIIWLPDTDDTSVINHELMHASIDIMRWTGMKLNDETEEAYAYEMQYLTKLFYEELNK